ncbi:MAG: 4'-phosphopantetheinyl transferase superfamily protein [Bacteroidaceae bacterium]|nr:4'-phosphopantetheinyl transferase superfamily protein [Bacteroidaceae bacterium]
MPIVPSGEAPHTPSIVRVLPVPPRLTPAHEQAIAALPAWRREQCLRFRHEAGRLQCLLSYQLLCSILREEYGIAEPPQFTYGEHGKPTLTDYPDLHFNLSHCRTHVACAVSHRPVGVDVESYRPYKESLARHTMNDDEMAAIASAPDPAVAFLRLWTQKEAVVKLTGSGLSVDLRSLLTDSPATVTSEVHPDYIISFATFA